MPRFLVTLICIAGALLTGEVAWLALALVVVILGGALS